MSVQYRTGGNYFLRANVLRAAGRPLEAVTMYQVPRVALLPSSFVLS